MRINIILTLCFLVLFEGLSAQTYMTAAGIRTGNSLGLTVSQRVLRKTTVEGILQNNLRTQTTFVHILAKQHKPVISRRFNVYAGAGVHMGVQNEGSQMLGFDGALGMEFTIARLNLSMDVKPQWSYGQGLYLNSGFSIRYVLLKDNVFRKWEKKRKKAKRKKEGNGPFWKRKF